MSVDSIQAAARPAPSAFHAAEANPASKSESARAPEQGAARSPQQIMQSLKKIEADLEALFKSLSQSSAGEQQSPAGQDGGGGANKGGQGAAPAGKGGGGSGGCGGGGGQPPAGGAGDTGGAGSAAGKPGAQDGGTAPPTNATGNKALIDEINRVRKEHGLNPVKEASNLDRAAAQNDAEQQKKGSGHHVDLGKNGASGEIAFMSSNGANPQNSVQGWLNSLKHREILLNPNLTKVGADISGQYSTADFS
jgi:uncharacterized protein YkwD